MANMVHATMMIGSKYLLIAVHTSAAPSEDEWAKYFAEFMRVAKVSGETLERYLAMAVTDGGAPNTKQRASIAAMVKKGKDSRGSAISNSSIVRGVVTVLSWLNPNYKAFAPVDLRRALRHLEIPSDQFGALERQLRELQKQLPQAKTIQLVADAFSNVNAVHA